MVFHVAGQVQTVHTYRKKVVTNNSFNDERQEIILIEVSLLVGTILDVQRLRGQVQIL